MQVCDQVVAFILETKSYCKKKFFFFNFDGKDKAAALESTDRITTKI